MRATIPRAGHRIAPRAGYRIAPRAGHRIARQLLKTVVASQAAFWLDFGILALLTEVAGLHYLASAAVSFLAGTTVSYILSVVWVFDTRRVASKTAEYALFVLVGVVGLGLNEGLLWLFTEPLGLHYLVSKIVAATLIFGWNFGARKLLLFR
jgi:putative flippase GtrA